MTRECLSHLLVPVVTTDRGGGYVTHTYMVQIVELTLSHAPMLFRQVLTRTKASVEIPSCPLTSWLDAIEVSIRKSPCILRTNSTMHQSVCRMIGDKYAPAPSSHAGLVFRWLVGKISESSFRLRFPKKNLFYGVGSSKILLGQFQDHYT